MKIKVSIPFVILLALLYVLDYKNVFFPTLIAVVIHEGAHILAARLCGGKVDLIDIRAFGVRINVPELRFMSYKIEIIIAAAGPIAGIITAIVLTVAARAFKVFCFDYFIGVNIAISLINLIPVYPLDGGRIVLSTALSVFSVHSAYVISYVFAIISIAALFSLCVFLAVKGLLNPSLVVFFLYIAMCGIKAKNRL